ncbi:MAG: holo-[acyl-carrier-protein] synthase [Acidobacteria bacterium 37-71-11]|nr:MAG: holo-[acyl-carrier-protein] synthase [Acidobacteria bacterium 37-71-11]HQT95969.1 holo-ACP synthase [Thermoanaerobaculaceae bacterium]
MIVGVGLDLVGVERVAAILARHGGRLLERCFAAGEAARPGDAEHVAGLLAAKEATFKALGTGWGNGVGWRDAVVERTASGAPRLLLVGGAAARAAALGVRTAHLSITHAAGVAVAVVILEA